MSKLRKSVPAYLFLLPAILLFTLLKIKPMIEGIYLSFFEANLKSTNFIGLANYIKLLQDPYFWLELKNTLIFVGIVIPLNLVLSLGIALVLFKFGHRIQSIFRGAFYLPAVSAGVVMSIVWLWIFNQSYGPLNYILSMLGFKSVLWLSQPNSARLAVSMVALNWIVGLNVILFLSALANIPREITESAEIDGANAWQKFFKITLPLIVPMTTYVIITTSIGIFQIWAAIYLLTAGGPVWATTSIVYRIYQLGFMYQRFGEASAHAVVLLGIIFSVAFFQFRYLNRRIEY